ncbi:L-iditol 2-dehydrogenase [Salibacterium salarium]|uniref:zinc-dependent alcohol dehydrogenase n=1 Tax=Salibacterium salarium TaxID=284579 RepID=UPI00277EBC53|nr:alcohol dehydrogenase catalytic domain-containing protein [Salibacterium salarium]MDQ0298049.1 L-iditol 2-dehydrogenase [Salibacterium salarium]
MTTNNQALVIKSPQSFNKESVPIHPEVKENNARVKVEFGGICGSDLSVYKGVISHARYPVVMGHELYGEVAEADKHHLFTKGQKVVVQPNIACGECDLCRKGKKNICRHKVSLGVTDNGGFSNYVDVPVTNLLVVPDDMDGKLAVLAEPLAVVVHAFRKISIEEGESVAVIGCGTEGMLSSILANLLGGEVNAVDINQEKLDMMKRFQDIHSGSPSILEEEYDHVIEAAGTPPSVEQAFDIVKPGGNVVIIGITDGDVHFPARKIVRSDATVFGSIIYDFPKDFQRAFDFLKNYPDMFTPIISKIYPFSDYEAAFETALSGRVGKVLLDFNEEE